MAVNTTFHPKAPSSERLKSGQVSPSKNDVECHMVLNCHRCWWCWWALLIPISAIVSVALAWACAIWSPANNQTGIVRTGPEHPFSQALLKYGNFDSFTYMSMSGIGWHRERVVGGRPTVPRTTGSLHRTRAGWPLLCMEGHWRRINRQRVEEAIADIPQWPGAQRNAAARLPLRPLWGPLLLNATILGLLPMPFFFAYGACRTLTRRRRGLCMACGYDLRGARSADAPCPECGLRVDQR